MKKILLLVTAFSSISLMGMEKKIIPINPSSSLSAPAPSSPSDPICTYKNAEECALTTAACGIGGAAAIIMFPFVCIKDTLCLPCDRNERPAQCYPMTKYYCCCKWMNDENNEG